MQHEFPSNGSVASNHFRSGILCVSAQKKPAHSILFKKIGYYLPNPPPHFHLPLLSQTLNLPALPPHFSYISDASTAGDKQDRHVIKALIHHLLPLQSRKP